MVGDRTLSFIDGDESGAGSGHPSPYLTVVMSSQRPLEAPARFALATAERVELGRDREIAGREFARERVDDAAVLRLRFDDAWMSSQHARLTRDGSDWMLEDAGSKNGTFLNGRPITRERLRDGDLLETGSQLLLFRDAVEWTVADPIDLDLATAGAPRGPIVTLHPPLARQVEQLRHIATSSAPVLIFGESGSGKEVFARAVHELSARTGAFVAVNCGALPRELVESQLFGHRRGAFSGAERDHEGLVRAAHGGTLFLDEIAELPATSQVALLRVLQEGEVLPVGATKPERVDIRVVAATHQDIEERRASGQFRDDLYGRLAGFSLALPALAERREDIGMITAALLRRIAGERATALRLARDAAYALIAYDWPLNIRELEHALGTALALAEGDRIELGDLPPAVRKAMKQAPQPRRTHKARETSAEELQRLLAEHAGNVSAVARALDRSRVHVHRLLQRFGIDIERFRT